MKKMTTALAVLSVCLLGGCASICRLDAPQGERAAYICANGAHLDVWFDRAFGRAIVWEDEGAGVELNLQVAGMGFAYAGAAGALAQHGRDVSWVALGGERTACRAPS